MRPSVDLELYKEALIRQYLHEDQDQDDLRAYLETKEIYISKRTMTRRFKEWGIIKKGRLFKTPWLKAIINDFMYSKLTWLNFICPYQTYRSSCVPLLAPALCIHTIGKGVDVLCLYSATVLKSNRIIHRYCINTKAECNYCTNRVLARWHDCTVVKWHPN